jgi:hypothetical protein
MSRKRLANRFGDPESNEIFPHLAQERQNVSSNCPQKGISCLVAPAETIPQQCYLLEKEELVPKQHKSVT